MSTSVIVDYVNAIGSEDPVIDTWAWRPPAPHVPSAVSFRNVPDAYIAPDDELGELWAAQLRSSRLAGIPAYAVIDGDRRITDVLVPFQARVRRVVGLSSRVFRIRTDGSNRRLTLTLTGGEESHRLGLLRLAEGTDAEFLITADPETAEILDVREAPSLLPRVDRRCLTRPQLMERLTGIDESHARALYADIARRQCELPLESASNLGDGLPFQVPDDLCWATAHVVTQELRQRQVIAGKAFVFDDDDTGPGLRVDTRNRSRCSQVWDWHVAPVVRVVTPGGDRALVFDHIGCFDEGPIEASAWKRKLGGAAARLELTEDWIYKQNGPCDPKPNPAVPASKPAADVDLSRALLWRRSRGRQSPPPYSHC